MKTIFMKFAVLLNICGSIASVAYAGTASGGCVIAGPENAPVTIEEFSDFECPYCAKGAFTMKQVLKDYDGKVKLVFRNMPLEFHKNATLASQAFTAVWLQSPSLAHSFYTKIFENQDRLGKEGEKFLVEMAEDVGADVVQMKTDMKGSKVAQILAEDKALAESLKFRGTPSFRIGTETVVGSVPYDDFKKVIDRQLQN
jgi:protein-disulfide isomerase